MKNKPEISQKKELMLPENIEQTIAIIEIFLLQQQQDLQWIPSIVAKHIKGDRACTEAVDENGFGYISTHIEDIQLPSFSKKEFILAKETFLHKEEGTIKYQVVRGYLQEIPSYDKENIASRSNNTLLDHAKLNGFASYIELEADNGHGGTNLFTIIKYYESRYLCFNKSRLFRCNVDAVQTNSQHINGENAITTDLYIQKMQALRQKMQRDIMESRKTKSQSSQIVDLFKNLEF